MSETIEGGCLCGAVRYVARSAPFFSGNCHCRDCQKSSGSGFVPAMMFARDTVTIEGEPTYFRVTADSGLTNDRGFCPRCGSQLFTKLEMLPHALGVHAGTLDRPDHFRPTLEFHLASKAPWSSIDSTLPHKPRGPRD